jgi:staphyloferrin B biosynthesis citrate synthase
VKDAVAKVISAARKAAKPVCVMVANAAEAKNFADIGASSFIIASDQSFMRRAAAQTLTDFKSLVQTTEGSHVSQH